MGDFFEAVYWARSLVYYSSKRREGCPWWAAVLLAALNRLMQ
jgi:hypothetical protein